VRILVTGGEGFIGSHIVERLCELKHHVMTLDNHDTYGLLTSEELSKLNQWRQRNWAPAVIKHRGTVTDADTVLRIFQWRPEVVIHLASYPRAKLVNKDPLLGVSNIINGTINLLQHCKNFGVKRFVFVSSSMIYGHFEDRVKESADTKPINIYGEAKLAAERFCKHFQQFSGVEYVIARPSGVYGPGDIPDRVVTKFYDQAVNDEDITVHKGINAVDFTYVTDAAEGIIKCATHPGAANLSFNISSGTGTELKHLAEHIVSMTDSKSSITEEGRDPLYPTRGALDISRARDLLGYAPQVSLLKGLNNYHEWILGFDTKQQLEDFTDIKMDETW
jgi:nucleoside-diphosphate-sugar epimerase